MARPDRHDVIDMAKEIVAIDGLRTRTRAKAATGRCYSVRATHDPRYPLRLMHLLTVVYDPAPPTLAERIAVRSPRRSVDDKFRLDFPSLVEDFRVQAARLGPLSDEERRSRELKFMQRESRGEIKRLQQETRDLHRAIRRARRDGREEDRRLYHERLLEIFDRRKAIHKVISSGRRMSAGAKKRNRRDL
ncbi:MAG TPA: hypothetical protein VNG12_16505 [Acidimicrobiales bacterium]|nr:hypothetical protein [Acidimicrobiales bacterium]